MAWGQFEVEVSFSRTIWILFSYVIFFRWLNYIRVFLYYYIYILYR